MNLSVNSLRQLLVVAVALFFSSCEDESKILGFKNPNQKFEGKYVEIPLETSVLVYDSVRTSNNYFFNEFDGMLVGNYEDAEFGNITCEAFTQYFPTIPSLTMPEDATEYKLFLQLGLDLYTYGSKTAVEQEISVYELTDDIDQSAVYYNNNSSLPVGPSLGSGTFVIDPGVFEDFQERNSNNNLKDDTTVVLHIELSQELASRLWAKWKGNGTKSDTAWRTYDLFKDEFKGIAVKTNLDDTENIVIRISPSISRLYFKYNTATKQNLETSLRISGMPQFSRIAADRNQSNSPLKEATPFIDFFPGNEKRYIQSGAGVYTKLKLDKFYDFASQDSVKDVLFNSAEIVIDEVEDSDLAPPSALAFRILKGNNRVKKLTEQELSDGSIDSDLYAGVITVDLQQPAARRFAFIDKDSALYAINDLGRGIMLTYSSDDRKYSGFQTLLFQRLYEKRDEINRYNSFLLYPTDPSITDIGSKSLNRVVFPGNKVTLRIYYTQPTVKKED